MGRLANGRYLCLTCKNDNHGRHMQTEDECIDCYEKRTETPEQKKMRIRDEKRDLFESGNPVSDHFIVE